MEMQRHLLAEFSANAPSGFTEQVVAGLLPPFRSTDIVSCVESCLETIRIPGIVCRPTQPLSQGQIQLGLSFPLRANGSRVRSAVVVQQSDIVNFMTPYQVLENGVLPHGPLARPLVRVLDCGASCGLQIGVIGSVALEIVTGHLYTTGSSDLDIVIAGGQLAIMREFYHQMSTIAQESNVRIDVEVLLSDGSGVKLTELLSESRTVLAKSLTDVCILDRAAVLRTATGIAA